MELNLTQQNSSIVQFSKYQATFYFQALNGLKRADADVADMDNPLRQPQGRVISPII